jgi:hypothetical protein
VARDDMNYTNRTPRDFELIDPILFIDGVIAMLLRQVYHERIMAKTGFRVFRKEFTTLYPSSLRKCMPRHVIV